MPPENHVNKEFFKSLLKNEKKAFKVGVVQSIIVPKIDELGVKHILEMLQDDAETRMYFPDEYFKKLSSDRTFFFNIINSVHPGFIPSLITGAQKQRVEVT